MSDKWRRLAGILLILLSTVIFGGLSLLTLLSVTRTTWRIPCVRIYQDKIYPNYNVS